MTASERRGANPRSPRNPEANGHSPSVVATVSGNGEPEFFSEDVPPDSPDLETPAAAPPGDPADTIDAEARREVSKLQTERTAPPPREDKAKAGPPRLDEWQDFFSRIIIRSATNAYIAYAFNGIDEELLSDREIERIKLSGEERDRIARPFAELANKTKFTRKHGRSIIALTDSWDSVLALGAWFSRVNRISRKYRQREPETRVRMKPEGMNGNVGPGQGEPVNGQEPRFYPYAPGSG